MASTANPLPIVLHLIDSFNQGGSERQALQLARLLKQNGRFCVKLAVLSCEGVLRSEAEQLDVGPIPSFPLNCFYDVNAARQVCAFARHLRAERVDVIHTHDFYTNIFGMAAAALAGVPVRIASRREIEGRSALQRWGERIAYGAAHAVVANCEEVRRRLLHEGLAPEKPVTIHNGLDRARVAPTPDLDRSAALASFGLPVDGRRFVTIVANLRWAIKDHPTFLRAARRVRAAVPDAAFVLAGEGPLQAPMQRLAAELGIDPDTFFLGRCDRLGDLLNVSEVCVLSSTSEGFSNSILEYMAAGKPVVATDVGGATEAILEGVTGYIVRPRDPESMAESIVRLLRNPDESRAMGERGRQRVLQEFSCEEQLRRTEQLYDHLLQHP